MFEAAYQPITAMGFGHALAALKDGHLVCRAGWNGKGMYLSLQAPDAHSKMSLPYIYICTVTADLVPWLASQTDLLAEDWMIVEGAGHPAVERELARIAPEGAATRLNPVEVAIDVELEQDRRMIPRPARCRHSLPNVSFQAENRRYSRGR